MLTGGFKKRQQAIDAIACGAVDLIGVARALVLNPLLANTWLKAKGGDPNFPRFSSTVEGGVTAWYSMRLTDIGEDREIDSNLDSNIDRNLDLNKALAKYEQRDALRCDIWRKKFSHLY